MAEFVRVTGTTDVKPGHGIVAALTMTAVRALLRSFAECFVDYRKPELIEQATVYAERAVEIAAMWPDAQMWGMEVRAVMSPDAGEEM